MFVEERDLESSADAWDSLATELDAAPFQRPGWTTAWWHAFGRGSLSVLYVRTSDRLSAIMPIARSRGVVRSPTNSETPLCSFLSTDDEAAGFLADRLLARTSGWLDLWPLHVDDRTIQAFTTASNARRFLAIVQPVLLSPYVSTDGAWMGYQDSLDARFRSEIRRRRRRLEETGEVRCEVVAGPERLDALLAEGFQVEASGWKSAHGTAIRSDPRRLAFYSDIAHWADEQGWLRLAFLRVDEHPIAFDLCLETDRVHFLLKTGFDHAFGKYGPGLILRWLMLERAFEGPIETYEFLGTTIGANNRWKLDWTDRYRERGRLRAFAPTVSGVIRWVGARYAVPVSNGVRGTVGRAIGPAGRDLAKRARHGLRKTFRR